MPEAKIALPTMRTSYETDGLVEDALAEHWYEQLQGWLDEAIAAGLPDANAMVLATADADGRPSARSVLAKGLDERGLVFYTNYTSAKSHDLQVSRYAAATFPWYGMHRQAHVRGPVEKVEPAETIAYWKSRPRGSQLGAWASAQSKVIRGGRQALESALASTERRFADGDVPVPPHWGGWRIRPDTVEFWQGRADRMHDRLVYRHGRDGWTVERLAP